MINVEIKIALGKGWKENPRTFGDKFVENNRNLKVDINGEAEELNTHYYLENDEISQLTIKFNGDNITDISNLFEECEDFEEIDISWTNISKIKKIDYIFKNCKNLKIINGLSEWNKQNLNRLIGLFFGCS